MRNEADTPLLEVDHIRKHFRARTIFGIMRKGVVHAVDDVSFSIRAHETFGLVGESGCGKTTTGRLILGLDTPSEGEIRYRGRPIHSLQRQDRHRYRSSVQAVFQDPWSSLNPRHRARSIIAEPLVINKKLSHPALDARIDELMISVGLSPELASHYPHQFSGGMRQRLAVARALALNPDLIVLDEPVSALDVSIRAQIMNLLRDLQARLGLAYLLIAHDLATIKYLCHRVGVMYLGQLVELGRAEEVLRNPFHPYTKALLSAAFRARPDSGKATIILPGDPPSPTKPPSGCRFHTRCPIALEAKGGQEPYWERARAEAPHFREVAPGHLVRCHRC